MNVTRMFFSQFKGGVPSRYAHTPTFLQLRGVFVGPGLL
jgi:hypothetical protein